MSDTGWRLVLVGAAMVSCVVPYVYWRSLWWRIYSRDNPPTDVVDQYYKWVGTVLLIVALPMTLLVAALFSPGS